MTSSLPPTQKQKRYGVRHAAKPKPAPKHSANNSKRSIESLQQPNDLDCSKNSAPATYSHRVRSSNGLFHASDARERNTTSAVNYSTLPNIPIAGPVDVVKSLLSGFAPVYFPLRKGYRASSCKESLCDLLSLLSNPDHRAYFAHPLLQSFLRHHLLRCELDNSTKRLAGKCLATLGSLLSEQSLVSSLFYSPLINVLRSEFDNVAQTFAILVAFKNVLRYIMKAYINDSQFEAIYAHHLHCITTHLEIIISYFAHLPSPTLAKPLMAYWTELCIFCPNLCLPHTPSMVIYALQFSMFSVALDEYWQPQSISIKPSGQFSIEVHDNICSKIKHWTSPPQQEFLLQIINKLIDVMYAELASPIEKGGYEMRERRLSMSMHMCSSLLISAYRTDVYLPVQSNDEFVYHVLDRYVKIMINSLTRLNNVKSFLPHCVESLSTLHIALDQQWSMYCFPLLAIAQLTIFANSYPEHTYLQYARSIYSELNKINSDPTAFQNNIQLADLLSWEQVQVSTSSSSEIASDTWLSIFRFFSALCPILSITEDRNITGMQTLVSRFLLSFIASKWFRHLRLHSQKEIVDSMQRCIQCLLQIVPYEEECASSANSQSLQRDYMSEAVLVALWEEILGCLILKQAKLVTGYPSTKLFQETNLQTSQFANDTSKLSGKELDDLIFFNLQAFKSLIGDIDVNNNGTVTLHPFRVQLIDICVSHLAELSEVMVWNNFLFEQTFSASNHSPRVSIALPDVRDKAAGIYLAPHCALLVFELLFDYHAFTSNWPLVSKSSQLNEKIPAQVKFLISVVYMQFASSQHGIESIISRPLEANYLNSGKIAFLSSSPIAAAFTARLWTIITEWLAALVIYSDVQTFLISTTVVVPLLCFLGALSTHYNSSVRLSVATWHERLLDSYLQTLSNRLLAVTSCMDETATAIFSLIGRTALSRLADSDDRVVNANRSIVSLCGIFANIPCRDLCSEWYMKHIQILYSRYRIESSTTSERSMLKQNELAPTLQPLSAMQLFLPESSIEGEAADWKLSQGSPTEEILAQEDIIAASSPSSIFSEMVDAFEVHSRSSGGSDSEDFDDEEADDVSYKEYELTSPTTVSKTLEPQHEILPEVANLPLRQDMVESQTDAADLHSSNANSSEVMEMERSIADLSASMERILEDSDLPIETSLVSSMKSSEKPVEKCPPLLMSPWQFKGISFRSIAISISDRISNLEFEALFLHLLQSRDTLGSYLARTNDPKFDRFHALLFQLLRVHQAMPEPAKASMSLLKSAAEERLQFTDALIDHFLRSYCLISKTFAAHYGALFTATYLMESRLKSMVGGALQTLQFLDSVLQFICKDQLRSAKSYYEGQPSSTSVNNGVAERFLIPQSLGPLLSFLMNLEKMTYTTKTSKLMTLDNRALLFFRSNTTSCDLFFNRIQQPLLQLSFWAKDMNAVETHAAHLISRYLQYLNQSICASALLSSIDENSLQVPDISLVTRLIETICDLSQAYVRLQFPDKVNGLLIALSSTSIFIPPLSIESYDHRPISKRSPLLTLNQLCPWLYPFELVAGGRYEEAMGKVEALLVSIRTKESTHLWFPRACSALLQVVYNCFGVLNDRIAISNWRLQFSRELQIITEASNPCDNDFLNFESILQLRQDIDIALLNPFELSSITNTLGATQKALNSLINRLPQDVDSDTNQQNHESNSIFIHPFYLSDLAEHMELHDLLTVLANPNLLDTPFGAAPLSEWSVALDSLLTMNLSSDIFDAVNSSTAIHSDQLDLSSIVRLQCVHAIRDIDLQRLLPLFLLAKYPSHHRLLNPSDYNQILQASFTILHVLERDPSMWPNNQLNLQHKQFIQSFLLSAAESSAQLNNYSLVSRYINQLQHPLLHPVLASHHDKAAIVSSLMVAKQGQFVSALEQLLPVYERYSNHVRPQSSPTRSHHPGGPTEMRIFPELNTKLIVQAKIQPESDLEYPLPFACSLGVFKVLQSIRFTVSPCGPQDYLKISNLVNHLVHKNSSPIDVQAHQIISNTLALQTQCLNSMIETEPQSAFAWTTYGKWNYAQHLTIFRELDPSSRDIIVKIANKFAVTPQVLYSTVQSSISVIFHQQNSCTGCNPFSLESLFTSLAGVIRSDLRRCGTPFACAEEVYQIARLVMIRSVKSLRAAVIAFLNTCLLLEQSTSSRLSDIPLYLLEILTTHWAFAVDLLFYGLPKISSHVWVPYLPQLLAHFGHSNSFVRASLRKILTNIGKRFPHRLAIPLSFACNNETMPNQPSHSPAGMLSTPLVSRSQFDNLIREIQCERALSGDFGDIQLGELCSESWPTPSTFDTIISGIKRASNNDGRTTSWFQTILRNTTVFMAEMERVGSIPEDYLLQQLRVIETELSNKLRLLVDEMQHLHISHGRESERKKRSRLRVERRNKATGKWLARKPESTFPDAAYNNVVCALYRDIFDPIREGIQHLKEYTFSLPGNNQHESEFKRKYLPLLDSLLVTCAPPDIIIEPQEFCQQISIRITELRKLLTKYSKLSLEKVTPLFGNWSMVSTNVNLGRISNSSFTKPSKGYVCLPGMTCDSDMYISDWPKASAISNPTETPYVASFGPTIEVIRAKTRPKKLYILGSDGITYPYLLKSNEDLRVDQRIIQALTLINTLLLHQSNMCDRDLHSMDLGVVSTAHDKSSTADHSCIRNPIPLRTYSVIPLSPKCGLVRWLPDMSTLYDVYRQHHPDRGTKGSVRGTELYVSKIRAYLQDAGLSTRLPRSEWPDDIVIRVLDESEADVQQDTLFRELWLRSDDMKHVSRKQTACVKSLAMMSIIGYVLGLGDRHLGNILLMGSTGEIAHIDYNIIFGRGEKLPIPELVPFRFTRLLQHIANPFSNNGEGLFESTCRSIFTVLVAHRFSILSLLSVFIKDPIAEWTQTPTTISIKRRLNEKRLSLALLIRRFKSIAEDLRLLLIHFDMTTPSLITYFNGATMEYSQLQQQSAPNQRRSNNDRYSVNAISKLDRPSKLHLLHKKEYQAMIATLAQLLQWHTLYNFVSKTTVELTMSIEKLHSGCDYLFHLYKYVLSESSPSDDNNVNVTISAYNPKDIQDAVSKVRESIRDLPADLTLKLEEIQAKFGDGSNGNYSGDDFGRENTTDDHSFGGHINQHTILATQAIDGVAKNLLLENYEASVYVPSEPMPTQVIASKVSSLIAAAVDRRRLARLYEGWAPWI